MNTNSFTQTTNDLVKQVNIALESMSKMNKSMTTEDDTVVITVEGYDPITGDPSTYTYSIPSYQYTIGELNRISNSMDTFINGQGVVLLKDGTYREVSTTPIAKSPPVIIDVAAPTKFQIRTNWFFESLLFPQMYIEFNLKGKIDDRSDRVKVKRIIFDNFDDDETLWFTNNFVGQYISYEDSINILTQNGKNYWTDEEIQNLPLNPTKYSGSFIIINKGVVNNSEWYYLDTLNYGLTADASIVNNIELNIGDQLRFNENLFVIDSIERTEKRVKITPQMGIGNPNINSTFYIYSPPFDEKPINIPVGYNECNILFIKGINDDYNIIADSWGDSLSFYTNDLVLTNSTTTLATYYFNYVVDFGKQMEGQAKERAVSAFYGVIPDAPSLLANQFNVNQINTQINAAFDAADIKTTQAQIESTKTIISSLKTTIAQQKAELVELTDVAQREDLQLKIDNNILQNNKKIVEHHSLVKSLVTIAYENSAVLGDPKYRVRGFFEIPIGKTLTDNVSEIPQEIIQFDISYRYLRLDNTGNPLNTFSYTDTLTDQKITGTYTDWQIVQSPIKTKVYDVSVGRYIWVTEIIANGEEVNINQIDIPITKGEKVDLKIRSISEAGWPLNPLKSSWSNSVIIDFPPNLEGSDQIANILADAIAEEAQIKLDETLSATGVITHLQDGYPNPNAGEGTYFKHQARYLSFDWSKKDIDDNVAEERSTDIQGALDDLTNKTFVRLQKPTGATDPEPYKTVTLQELFQRILDIDPSVYDELTNTN